MSAGESSIAVSLSAALNSLVLAQGTALFILGIVLIAFGRSLEIERVKAKLGLHMQTLLRDFVDAAGFLTLIMSFSGTSTDVYVLVSVLLAVPVFLIWMQLIRFKKNVRQGSGVYFVTFGILLWIIAIFAFGIWYVFDVKHFHDLTFAWLSLIMAVTIGIAGSMFILYPLSRQYGKPLHLTNSDQSNTTKQSSLKQAPPSSMGTMSGLQTREASTLTIVTFVASASLLFLTISNKEIEISSIAPIGFMFGALGLSYRQITAWSVDRIQHNREVDLDEEARFWRNRFDVYLLWSFIRGFVWLWVLLIPIVLWGMVWYNQLNGITISQSYSAVNVSIATSVIINVIDILIRIRDWHRHH